MQKLIREAFALCRDDNDVVASVVRSAIAATHSDGANVGSERNKRTDFRHGGSLDTISRTGAPSRLRCKITRDSLSISLPVSSEASSSDSDAVHSSIMQCLHKADGHDSAHAKEHGPEWFFSCVHTATQYRPSLRRQHCSGQRSEAAGGPAGTRSVDSAVCFFKR